MLVRARTHTASASRQAKGIAIAGERAAVRQVANLTIGEAEQVRALPFGQQLARAHVRMYNPQNIFLYRFDYQDRPVTRTGISQFPIFPSFGVEFES